MMFSKPIEEIIISRKSVRTYNNTTLSDDQKAQINQYLKHVESPFEGVLRFKLIDKENNKDSSTKIGTYGIIHGVKHFICIAIKKQDSDAAFNLGYSFEKIVLFLASINLGTCWLGGTFNKGDFASAMQLQEDEMLPIVSPVGKAANNKSLIEKMMRGVAGSDNRKPFSTIFFLNNFDTPLTEEMAAEYKLPLEMVRLAPSASNKQPWNIVKSNNDFHFYINNKAGYSVPLYDFSKNDLGIAMCHFELTAIEKGLKGKWINDPTLAIAKDANHGYVRTWKTE